MSLSTHTKSRLARIQREYNPEYDVPPGPPVTWAEIDLTEAVIELAAKVESLEARLNGPKPAPAPNLLTCPNCHGTGAQPMDGSPDWIWPACPTCKGEGVI